jgi:hypothetical protein
MNNTDREVLYAKKKKKEKKKKKKKKKNNNNQNTHTTTRKTLLQCTILVVALDRIPHSISLDCNYLHMCTQQQCPNPCQ